MQKYSQAGYRHMIVVVMVVMMGILVLPSLIYAQETNTPVPQGAALEITGEVSAVNGNIITVAGLTIDASAIGLNTNIVTGTTVTIVGQFSNNVVIAQTIIIVQFPDSTLTPEATPEATATVSPTPSGSSNVIIVVEGPVINIVDNIITIYSFDIEVAPQHPILNIIDVGDIIRVEGAFGNTGIIVANVVSNISTTTVVSSGTATVGLEGPVEAINGNIIVVNGIPAQLAPNAPLLQTVQIGNFVSLQGNFETSGTTIVLVVVNVVIVNNVVVTGDPLCWYHDNGMGMGHWHCDGMGMGMGMGDDGMGMGMGDDGMGMGMGMGN